MVLEDKFGRRINYLRLAVTDRCNLRCHYCLPEGFHNFLPKDHLLSFEEIIRLLRIVSSLGVTKLRITGGEPFVRKDLMTLLRMIHQEQLFESLHMTTNGVLTEPHIEELVTLGFKSINLSLDSLDRKRFLQITKRDEFERVMNTLLALEKSVIKTKINAVVMAEENTQDILPFVQFTQDHDVHVRFIEEMPFNGTGRQPKSTWNFKAIESHITSAFDLEPLTMAPGDTAQEYSIKGHIGSVGIIAAASRTFCGSCNRLRIGPRGDLQSCLYGPADTSLFDLFRSGADDLAIAERLTALVSRKPKDGFAAEKELVNSGERHASMATIGG
ncbi:GTP 3',8-cyclase MoaA [Sanyastnella coralliicola]|uniref:GTP 3',8-cyclase MoaA n=1 Tax=Sanyastnella coralliicola TaxID=3069118 RepID=UPI0027BADA8F|nr:GTP 3',8-cyclase MoaA [Longitalea sp. SCSIO 12813]